MIINITQEERDLLIQLTFRLLRENELPKKEFDLIQSLIKKIV